MPVCSVAPSGMKARACSAIARVDLDRARRRAARSARPRSRRARRSRRRAARGGGRAAAPKVRGKRSETSTTSARSGSRPRRGAARPIVPPACSDSEHQPSRVGRRGGRRHDARRLRARAAARSGGSPPAAKLDVRARVAQRALDRAEEARQVVDPRCGRARVPTASSAPSTAQVLPVVALASARRNAGGCPVPSGIPSVSVARTRSGSPRGGQTLSHARTLPMAPVRRAARS